MGLGRNHVGPINSIKIAGRVRGGPRNPSNPRNPFKVNELDESGLTRRRHDTGDTDDNEEG